MGEYANYKGERIKVGTCEDMYYLRADQRDLVQECETDLHAHEDVIRFRFPFPAEDNIEPGGFEDHDRSIRLDGMSVPEGVEHGSVQFSARNGYLCMLPCPESGHESERRAYSLSVPLPEGGEVHVAKNGYGGAVHLVQQAYRGGRLVGIAKCGGCGAVFRLEDGHELEAKLALLEIAEREYRTAEQNQTPGNANIARRYVETARRLMAGYGATVEATAARDVQTVAP